MEKVCEVCGISNTETRIIVSRKFGMVLCDRHRMQMYSNGKILDRTIHDPNEIIDYGDCAEILTFDKDGVVTARVLIDSEDIEKASKYKWRRMNNGYIANTKAGLLHRFLMSPSENMQVDHKNHNILDNMKKNLRLATHADNTRNQRKREGLASKYKDVYWDMKRRKWVSQIHENNKNIYLGSYEFEAEAAMVYNVEAIKRFGEFALLNKIGDKYE